jgi:hypothetical protein
MSALSVQQRSASVKGLHVPWYRLSMVEMSRWNRSPFSSLTAPRFSGMKSSFVGLYKISLHITISASWFPTSPPPKKKNQKTGSDFFNDFRAAFSTSLVLSSNFTSYINSLIWGATNTPFLTLASFILGTLHFKYINPAWFLYITLMAFLRVQV